MARFITLRDNEASPGSVRGELGLHSFKQATVKDRLTVPAVHLAPIGDLADVEPVL